MLYINIPASCSGQEADFRKWTSEFWGCVDRFPELPTVLPPGEDGCCSKEHGACACKDGDTPQVGVQHIHGGTEGRRRLGCAAYSWGDRGKEEAGVCNGFMGEGGRTEGLVCKCKFMGESNVNLM